MDLKIRFEDLQNISVYAVDDIQGVQNKCQENTPYCLRGQWAPCVQWRCRSQSCPRSSERTGSEPSAALQHLVTRSDSKSSRPY